jgi:hypothetical protein
MNPQTEIIFGHIRISLPNESASYFSIFENLADLFGTDFQSEAVELLRTELKKMNVKPKPNLDFESDYTQIDSRNANTIFAVANVIYQLTLPDRRMEIKGEQLEEIHQQLKKWKRPPRQKWKVGDVFSIPLLDGSFSFGQIIGTHLTAKSPIMALFEIRQTADKITVAHLLEARVLSVWNSDDEDLSNHKYKVLFNAEIIISPDKVKDKKESGGATMDNLANVYFGIEPYNVMADEYYYDDYWQPNIKRPEDVLWLNREERIKYRREKFNIDENGNYIK